MKELTIEQRLGVYEHLLKLYTVKDVPYLDPQYKSGFRYYVSHHRLHMTTPRISAMRYLCPQLSDQYKHIIASDYPMDRPIHQTEFVKTEECYCELKELNKIFPEFYQFIPTKEEMIQNMKDGNTTLITEKITEFSIDYDMIGSREVVWFYSGQQRIAYLKKVIDYTKNLINNENNQSKSDDKG